MIAAMPGQTIELSIVDFGNEMLKRRPNGTDVTYGYITDGDKRIQITGDLQRERNLYTSTTDEIMIEITPREDRDQAGFLIQYKSMYIYFLNLTVQFKLCHPIYAPHVFSFRSIWYY